MKPLHVSDYRFTALKDELFVVAKKHGVEHFFYTAMYHDNKVDHLLVRSSAFGIEELNNAPIFILDQLAALLKINPLSIAMGHAEMQKFFGCDISRRSIIT